MNKEVSVVITTTNPEGKSRVILQKVPERDIFYDVVLPEHGRWRPTLVENVTLSGMVSETESDEGLRRIANKMVNAALVSAKPVTHMVTKFYASDNAFVLGVHLPFSWLREFRPQLSGEFSSFTLEQLNVNFIAVTDVMREDFPWHERSGMIQREMTAVLRALGDAPREHHAVSCPQADVDPFSFPEGVPAAKMPILPEGKLGRGGGLPPHMTRSTVTAKR